MGEASSSSAYDESNLMFQSNELEELLDIIDQLRLQGLGKYVGLPQLIVCGDQSSGKSSVLEAISGVRFPTKDNLCTRFPTELILRRKAKVGSTASIVLVSDDTESEVIHHTLSEYNDHVVENFEAVVDAAGKFMGLGANNKSFSNDILRVEITSPKLPDLTLVDLPGLFHAQSKSQSTADAETVKAMVIEYMKMPRSIILAVVSAKNDYANQVVTTFAQEVDPHGKRTMGIVTKPDTLDKGSESEKHYLDLVQNLDVKLRLGWHVLRNRDFTTKDCTAEERDQYEAKFFSQSPWTRLDVSQLGIGSLKPRLSRVLHDQILTELPSLISELESSIKEYEARLKRLGNPRSSKQEQRLYLHQISERFSSLVQAAIQGHYDDDFFRTDDSGRGYPKRIRAVVNNLLDDFAKKMLQGGHQYQVVGNTGTPEKVPTNKVPIPVSREQRLRQIAVLIKENRGMELPGFQRDENITMLFREQCTPWSAIVRESTRMIFKQVKGAIHAAVDAVSDELTANGIKQMIITPCLEEINRDVEDRVSRNLDQHVKGHPITFNHYFTDNLQKLRAAHESETIANQLREASLPPPSREDIINWVSKTLTSRTERDMQKFTCSEALHFMEAYYKVALKFFIDDFSIHTIEEGLLQKLGCIFNSTKALSLDDVTVDKIAGESEQCRHNRNAWSIDLGKLQQALRILRNLDHGNISSPQDEKLMKKGL